MGLSNEVVKVERRNRITLPKVVVEALQIQEGADLYLIYSSVEKTCFIKKVPPRVGS